MSQLPTPTPAELARLADAITTGRDLTGKERAAVAMALLRLSQAEQERDASDAALHELRKLYGAITDDLTMDPKYPWESAPQSYKAAWHRVRDLLKE